MKRVFFAAGFLSAVGLGFLILFSSSVAFAVAGVLFVAAAIVGIILRRHPWSFRTAICFLLIATVFLRYHISESERKAVTHALIYTKTDIVATVIEEPRYYPDYTVYDVITEWVGADTEQHLRFSLLMDDKYHFEPFDRFWTTVNFTELQKGYEGLSLSEHIYLSASARGSAVPLEPSDRYVFKRFFVSLRQDVRREILDHLPTQTAGILCGLLIGGTDEMDEETERIIRESGLSHTVAVSGLHMSVLVSCLLFLCSLGRLPRQLGYLIATPLLIGYAALSGLSPSAVRSVFMIIVIFAADFIHRRADRLNLLGLAAWILLLVNPYRIYSYSFILSFAALLGLLALSPILNRYTIARLPSDTVFGLLGSTVLTSANGSLAATVATFPLVLFLYGGISAVGILANVLASFLITTALVTGMVATAVGFISFLPHLSAFLYEITDLLLWCVRGIADVLTRIPYHYLKPNTMVAGLVCAAVLVILAGIFVLAAAPTERRHRIPAASLAALTAVLILTVSFR